MKTAYLYLTHFLDEHVEGEFVKLQENLGRTENVFLLYHHLPGQPPLGSEHLSFIISDEDIQSLGFKMMQNSIVPGHLVFLTILFARAHPEFTHYWTIEQDVRYTGNWRNFFLDVNQSSADFLATHVRGFQEEPSWWWWRTFYCPSQDIPIEKCIRSFTPMYRLSQNAIYLLDEVLRQGCEGHTEVIVPSILQHNGLIVEDFGGAGAFVRPCNKRRHYSSITLKNGRLMHGGTFAAAPARTRPGWRRNWLYHPVKAQSEEKRGFVPLLGIWRVRLRMLVRSLAWQIFLKCGN